MPTAPTPELVLRQTAKLLRKHKGDRIVVARELGLTRAGVESRIFAIRQRLPDEELPAPRQCGPKPMEPALIAEVAAAVVQHGSKSAAARALGVSYNHIVRRLAQAELRDDWKPATPTFRKASRRPLPPKGKVFRYLAASAQNDAVVDDKLWRALAAFRKHYKAELLVSTFTYNHRLEGSAKRGTEHQTSGQYDPRIEPHVCDEPVVLAPTLTFCGELNVLPTAVDPLSGFDSYDGQTSIIVPHTKVAMKSVAAYGGSAKLMYTTGAVTKPSYRQKKAGQKAQFHHVLGALIVEVNHEGDWWVRQLSIDRQGRVFDVNVVAMETDGEYAVAPSIGCAALVFGDLHDALLPRQTIEEKWGPDGMVAALRPDTQVAHDILDFESRGHHNRRDPHKMFALHARGKEDVRQEIVGVGELLKRMAAHSRVCVAQSNHDLHLERWLKEADWRTDPVNAELYVDAQKAYLTAIRKGDYFDALKWAIQSYNPVRGVRFLRAGESYAVCRDAGGGIELAMHGDRGPGGSRGSARNLSRMGRKAVIGHSHSACIVDGVWQVGVSARLDMDYAKGAPSAWSHTDCVVHRGGKRQMLTWRKGKWRA